MELYDALERVCCQIGLKGAHKPDVLRELARLSCKSARLSPEREDEVYQALLERENQGSTGFGNSVAIPHARLKNMTEFVLAIGVHDAGVDFDSLDKKRVRLFFVILGPEEQVNDHLKLLAAVSRALTKGNTKRELLSASTGEALYESFLRNAEGLADERAEKPKLKLLVLILYLEEYVYEILELYLQKGIDGATIIDSFGMGEYISNVPLFATFIGFMQEKKNHSKTILAMVPESMESELIEGVESILGDLDKKQGAMIFSVDVGRYKGSMKML